LVPAPGLGFRLRIAVTFDGPSLSGSVLPGGGDWLLSRRDGSTELDIRFALRTAEGEAIYLRSFGLFVADAAVTARIRGGEDVPSDAYYFRTAILFEAGAPRLGHLNRTLHIGVGQRRPNGMVTDIFALS
jgi:hypothetical protein